MKRFPTSSMSALLVLGVMVCAPLGDARSQPANTIAGGQDADQLFQKGKVLYQGGKYREAHEALRAAWASKKSFDIAGNLGTVELVLGMSRDAAEHLAYGIRTFPSTGNKKQLAATKQQFDEARAQVGALKIKVNVEGAEVLIDGVSIGRSPIQEEVFVNPGERTIEVRLAGYEPAKQSAKVAKGGSQSITLSLVAAVIPPPVASAVASAVPAVSASASASVAPPPVPSGTAAPIVPVGAGGPSKPVLITGGIAAGAALIAGVVFVVVSNGKSIDVQEQLAALRSTNGARACTGASVPGGCPILQDAIGAKDTFANLALWSFVGAGALGIGTAIYALAAPKGLKTTEVRAAPIVTANGGGIVIGGAW